MALECCVLFRPRMARSSVRSRSSWSVSTWLTFVIITITLFASESNSNTVQLMTNNIDEVLQKTELVFVNFYADWCRFSQMLAPVFDDTAKKVAQEYPDPGKVVLAKVDCDKETGIATKYHVSKYPTLKLFRHGSLVKREYRGQRSAEAISNYIREQLDDIVNTIPNIDDVDTLSRKKRHIVGYFEQETDEDYTVFKKVASKLREDCKFHAAIGEVSQKDRIAGNKVVFRPDSEQQADMLYSGKISEESILLAWSQDKCVPLVREITFENAEELTEEGLPFMILFHHPDDTQSSESYRRIVGRELVPDKNSVNFLVADGKRFAHPLHHLGKTESDLPVLAIDSFRHMYLWPHSAKTDLEKPGLIKQFIADLHSGKLHREFHHGPDTTQPPKQDSPAQAVDSGESHVQRDNNEQQKDVTNQPKGTAPPESTFKKLAPSKTRYTLLKDEL